MASHWSVLHSGGVLTVSNKPAYLGLDSDTYGTGGILP